MDAIILNNSFVNPTSRYTFGYMSERFDGPSSYFSDRLEAGTLELSLNTNFVILGVEHSSNYDENVFPAWPKVDFSTFGNIRYEFRFYRGPSEWRCRYVTRWDGDRENVLSANQFSFTENGNKIIFTWKLIGLTSWNSSSATTYWRSRTCYVY